VSPTLELEEQMRFGMVVAGQTRDAVLGLARRIEAIGFDSVWVGDHVSFHIPIMESLTLLSFLAAATERLRLGTSVYLMPLRHPTNTAKVCATLDVLSGGRLALGVGVGGEFPPEFEATGADLAARGPVTDEGIDILRRLWSEPRVEHRGEHFSFGPVGLDPKPIQPGGPPILVGGRKRPSFRRAGTRGDGYISHMCSAEQYATNLEVIRREAAEAGRSDVRFETHAFLFTLLDDDHDAALDRAARMLGTIYNRPFRDAAKKYCLLGRAEDCAEQLHAFVRAGCRGVIFSPLMDPMEFAERAGNELLPELRRVAIPG
jgi:probable F420-dependent oxidoreductase